MNTQQIQMTNDERRSNPWERFRIHSSFAIRH